MTIPNPIIPEAPMANAIDDVKDLNCPFCGGAPERKLNPLYGNLSMVQCRHCGAELFDRKWNTRAVGVALSEDARGFLVALLGADTWVEAGAVWDGNPDQRKSAHVALLTSPAPSQHTGGSDEAVQRFMDAMFGEYSNPFNTQTWVPTNWQETKAKVRTALTAASSIAPETGFEVKDIAAEFEHGVTQQTQDYRFEQGPGGDWLFQCSDWLNISAILTRISSSTPPKTVDAKKLQWVDVWGKSTAKTPLGVYQVKSRITDGAVDVSLANGAGVWSTWASTAENGKAAAQAHFEARIRSSISPSVAKESGEPS